MFRRPALRFDRSAEQCWAAAIPVPQRLAESSRWALEEPAAENRSKRSRTPFSGKAERLAPLKGAGCGAQGREGPERSGGPHPTPPPLFGFGLARACIGEADSRPKEPLVSPPIGDFRRLRSPVTSALLPGYVRSLPGYVRSLPGYVRSLPRLRPLTPPVTSVRLTPRLRPLTPRLRPHRFTSCQTMN